MTRSAEKARLIEWADAEVKAIIETKGGISKEQYDEIMAQTVLPPKNPEPELPTAA